MGPTTRVQCAMLLHWLRPCIGPLTRGAYASNHQIKGEIAKEGAVRRHTLSWLATESSWLVGERRTDPVPDCDPEIAYELCVVSHEYRLNGRPFTWIQTVHLKSNPKTQTPNTQSIISLSHHLILTLDLGSNGWIRTHLARELPHASQCNPLSQSLSFAQLSPTCKCKKTQNEEEKGFLKERSLKRIRRRRKTLRAVVKEMEYANKRENEMQRVLSC